MQYICYNQYTFEAKLFNLLGILNYGENFWILLMSLNPEKVCKTLLGNVIRNDVKTK